MAPPVMSFRGSINRLVLKSLYYSSRLAKLNARLHATRLFFHESKSRMAGPWLRSLSVKTSLPQYHLFDVVNVSPHSRLRCFSVTAFDRSQDPPVAGE